MSHRFHTTVAGRPSGAASKGESYKYNGPIHWTRLPDVPSRKRERRKARREGQAFSQRRALLVQKVRGRAAHCSARSKSQYEEPAKGVGVRAPASREAKNAPNLWRSREAV